MLTLTNRIDMRPGAVPLVIHLGQYDSDFTLVFELYSSAGNFTVESGTTAMIRGTKTDGHAYDADATLDVSAKTVTVAGSEQMTAAKGRNVYELVLTKSGKVLSTANFILDVERAAMDADTIASESVLKELNAIIAGAETATEAADRAEDAADSVSSASTQIATNASDIADLKADLGEYFGKTAISMSTSAQFINLSGTTADINNPSSSGEGFHYGTSACAAGDVFEVNAVGGAGARAWGFISSDGTILTVADALATVNTEVTAPANSAYFIVNDKSGQTSYKLNGDTIPERVSALESDVVELQEEVDNFEGISDEVKEALLACFRHVPFLDDEADYYGALEEALYGTIPEIKVFLGKGTSGTTIVDNAKRALSEPIPFTNEIPITMQWADNNGYVWQPKPLTSQHGIAAGIIGIDNDGNVWSESGCVMHPDHDGFWVYGTNEQTLKDYNGTVNVKVQDTDGTFRILFANGTDQTAELPSTPPSGFFFVGNKKYRLVVGNNEEFI